MQPKIGVGFAEALRHVLRQDPDVIMVGEVRDAETAEIALQAALTGHMVLATLHTNDAATAITRLLELGVDPFVLVVDARRRRRAAARAHGLRRRAASRRSSRPTR